MIITISRQYASNGILIGRLVADRLGMRVYDREFVDEIARQMHVHPSVIPHLAQALGNPVHSVLLEWRASVNPEVYVRHLRGALNTIGKEGNAVIVGSGANFVLRRPDALNVRIIAPLELRAEIFRAGNDLSPAEAQRIVEKRDRERVLFVKRIFRRNIDNALHYDLMINLQGLTPELAAEMIIQAAQARRQANIEVSPQATLPDHLRMMVHARHHVRPEIVERYRNKV